MIRMQLTGCAADRHEEKTYSSKGKGPLPHPKQLSRLGDSQCRDRLEELGLHALHARLRKGSQGQVA